MQLCPFQVTIAMITVSVSCSLKRLAIRNEFILKFPTMCPVLNRLTEQ